MVENTTRRKTARITAKLVGRVRRLSETVSDDVCCPQCVVLLARGITGHGHGSRPGRPARG